MAEDSGAFKTNQANSRQIRPFSRDPPEGRCNQAAPARETLSGIGAGVPPAIFNKRRESVAVFSNQPDSRALSAASRTRPVLWSPRSRWLKGLCKIFRPDIS